MRDRGGDIEDLAAFDLSAGHYACSCDNERGRARRRAVRFVPALVGLAVVSTDQQDGAPPQVLLLEPGHELTQVPVREQAGFPVRRVRVPDIAVPGLVGVLVLAALLALDPGALQVHAQEDGFALGQEPLRLGDDGLDYLEMDFYYWAEY